MAFLRKVPDRVTAKLNNIATSTVLVACAVRLSEATIASLGLARLGITVDGGRISVPDAVVFPDSSFGQVADENSNGKEVIDKDSPKVTRYIYYGDRPEFGDWTRGSFSLWQHRRVYRKTFIQPRGYSIKITAQNAEAQADRWRVTFALQPPIERSSPDFDTELIFALSLLREVTTVFDVFASNVSLDDIASTRSVVWDIFPPGQRDLTTELAQRLERANEQTKGVILARARVIESLNPQQYILGAGLASNYYGALFADDLVVFENLEYGNATYILYENWERLSQLSRTELLNGQENFERIIHDAAWTDKLQHIVRYQVKSRQRRRR